LEAHLQCVHLVAKFPGFIPALLHLRLKLCHTASQHVTTAAGLSSSYCGCQARPVGFPQLLLCCLCCC
jgi:hypothetical protein